MKHKAGARSGFAVFQDRRGLILQYLGKDGIPRKPPASFQKWFADNVVSRLSGSQIERMFGVTETMRQRMGLSAHMRRATRLSMAEQVRSGQLAQLESLDLGRSIPSTSSGIADLPPDRLPRHYTYVRWDLSPPRRFILHSEYSFQHLGATMRPDEIIVSYEPTARELELIREGTSFLEIQRQHGGALKGVRNFALKVWDDNTDLTGARAVEHVRWTSRYLRGALQHVLTQTKLWPQGLAAVDFKELYRDAAHYVIGEYEVRTERTSGSQRLNPQRSGALRSVIARIVADFGDSSSKTPSVVSVETEAFGHSRALLSGPIARQLKSLGPKIQTLLAAVAKSR